MILLSNIYQIMIISLVTDDWNNLRIKAINVRTTNVCTGGCCTGTINISM